MGFQLARNSPYHYLKHLFDVALSSVLLVICFPLMAAAACLIWLTNSRPALFRQARVGREGEVFTIYKFRTMAISNGAENDDIYTRENDPRIKRVGRWMRKLRLDDIPQLFNYLRDDMCTYGLRV